MSVQISKCNLCGRMLPPKGYTVLVKRVGKNLKRKTRRKVHPTCLARLASGETERGEK